MAIYRSAREEERVRQGRRSYHKGAAWPDLVARAWQGRGACPQVTATVGYPIGQPLRVADTHGSRQWRQTGGTEVIAQFAPLSAGRHGDDLVRAVGGGLRRRVDTR